MDIAPPLSPISKHAHTKITLPPLLLHDSPTFLSHCWSLRRSCRRGVLLSLKWTDLVDSGELKAWEEKRCKFWQLDTDIHLECSHMDGLRIFLRSSTEIFFRSVLREHGVDVDCLRLVDIKLLRTAHNEGLQEIHCDIPDPALGALCFTCLLYLTATTSTAVPLAPHSADRHDACYVADASTVRSSGSRLVLFCCFAPKKHPLPNTEDQRYPQGVER